MSEERPLSSSPDPSATTKAAKGTPSDGAIDVPIDEDEPEMAPPKPLKPPEAAPASSRAEPAPRGAEGRVGETTRRGRAKLTLRIPDDEVSRPQVTPSAPPSKPVEPAPEPPMVPMTPMRIITIETPIAAPAPKAAPAPPAASPRASSPPSPAPGTTSVRDDSWTPYQPTVERPLAQPAPLPQPPAAPPRPPRPSHASVPPSSLPQAPLPPRASHHSAPPAQSSPAVAPALVPPAPPTAPMPPAPPTEPHDSLSDIPIVTDALEEPPPSSGEIEVDEDSRPTKPAVLHVPEPKLVAPPLAAQTTPVAPAVHSAVTPIASPVAVAPPVVAAPPPPAAAPAPAPAVAPPVAVAPPPPVAPSPPRIVPAPGPPPGINIKDLPPMRALAPTEPEGLEVKFEDEETPEELPISSTRTSEPEAEIAAEDLVSVESAPAPRAMPMQVETPARAFPVGAAQATAVPAVATRASVPPPPSIAKSPAALKGGAPRVIVPSASALAPPPMSESAPTGRRKARPWWEELFNDDFIRTMAKISDAQIGKEVDFVEESLAVAKGAMLLDLACGTGRHAIELTRRGYKVVGFDLSLPMLAKAAEEAQERGQKLNFVQGDMREMTFEDTFDGIYCWNTSFGFFEEDKNAQVVQRVHKALKKGGQFLLEVGNRDFIIRQAPSLAWFEGDGCICMDEMSIDWITSRMKVKRTMMMDDGRTKEIDYSVRIYSLHELGKVLHDAGFRVAEVSGRTGTPGVFFGNESPRTMILAEKK